MAQDTREANGLIVDRYTVIGTTTTVCVAYEPSSLFGRHSTITHLDGYDGWLGRVGTRRLPAEIEALPAYSDERRDAYRAWHDAECQEAYAAIVAAFPEAADGRRSGGEIMTTGA